MPLTDYYGGKGAYLSTASPSTLTDHSGDDGASTIGSRPPSLTDGAFATTHRRTYPQPPRSFAPDGSFQGQWRDHPRKEHLKTRPSCPKAPATRANVPHLPLSRQTIPGMTERHLTRDIATSIIPSDAPTSPPAPSHAAAPARGVSKKGKDTDCYRSTAPSVRTRSQAGTRATRTPAETKPVSPATKGPAESSAAQKIPHKRESPTEGATKEKQGERRTHTAATPMSPTGTSKDPTQSSHYRLWGPGFLDVSLLP